MNVGGLVGHCALRVAAMGDRCMEEGSGTPDDIALMCDMAEEALQSGALGISTSRTLGHVVPDGRPVPGTWAGPDELLAFGEVLRRSGRGLFEGAMRLGERDDDALTGTRAEVAVMGEISRRSGRPVSYGLVQSNRRPDLYTQVIEFTKQENASGALVRPQTTARGIGILFGLFNRTPWDRAEAFRELRELPPHERLAAIREPQRRERLIAEAATMRLMVEPDMIFVLPPGPARYDCREDDSLASHARRRGVTPVEAFLDLASETDGTVNLNLPLLNQRLDAVEVMLDDPLITRGLADAGAHVGQIMDTSQPTFLLTYWVRERQRWTLEEAVRRLTSDTAGLFGFTDRGVLRAGAFADVNVIDLDALTLPQPEFVHDLPNGAGRYIQGASGYDYTIVNGSVFMDHGTHTGEFAGRVVRSQG
jgi:N-acyl-D-aspartate/D-glutamate deacylase